MRDQVAMAADLQRKAVRVPGPASTRGSKTTGKTPGAGSEVIIQLQKKMEQRRLKNMQEMKRKFHGPTPNNVKKLVLTSQEKEQPSPVRDISKHVAQAEERQRSVLQSILNSEPKVCHCKFSGIFLKFSRYFIYFYTPRNEVRGGILESPCPSVRPSVRPSVCRRARLGKIARLGLVAAGGYFVPLGQPHSSYHYRCRYD